MLSGGSSLQPILVLPVYRGGERFPRALKSLIASQHWFSRLVISSNGPPGNDDWVAALALQSEVPRLEVINTGRELPWMEHQYFWLRYLENTGARSDDWVCWFAHDDEILPTGISHIVDESGSWPLQSGVTYLGPWAMRHEQGDRLFDGPRDTDLEYWTSFPVAGPLRLSVASWIGQQLEQPTYINMSGCVTQLQSFQSLRDFPIPKPGGMRIEMATAAAPNNRQVAEFDRPVVITYGRPNSDRTQYAKVARQDDRHLLAWLTAYLLRHPSGIPATARSVMRVMSGYFRVLIKRGSLPAEEWRRRGFIAP